MAVYKYCNNCNGSQLTRTVSFSQDTCVTTTDQQVGIVHTKITSRNVKVTIPTVATCDIPVRIKVHKVTVGPSGTNTTDNYITVTIIQGTTATTQQVECTHETVVSLITNPPSKSTTTVTNTYSLNDQLNVPTCSQPGTCHLGFSSFVITNPSGINTNSGKLVVTASGSTGGTIYYQLFGYPLQTNGTFTGLTSGDYQIYIFQPGGCFDTRTFSLYNTAYVTSPFSVTEPSRIVASENPIPLTLYTAAKDGVSQPGKFTMVFNSGSTSHPNGTRLYFKFNNPLNYEVNFTYKDFPNRNDYILSDKLKDSLGNSLKNNTVTDIANSFAQALQNDLVFNRTYYINQSANTVTLVSKQSSSRFNIKQSSTSLNPNINYFQAYNSTGGTGINTTGQYLSVIQNGTDNYEGSLIDNYKIYTEVYAPTTFVQYGENLNNVEFERITELQLPFQIDNIHTFNFSDICKSFVSTPKPNFEFTGFTTLVTSLKPFYFKFGDSYPLVSGQQGTTKKTYKGKTGYVWVLNAAIDYERPNDISSLTGTTVFGLARFIPFLTNSPTIKHASKQQRELLYFIVPKDLYQSALSLYGDIQFWDGSILSHQKLITISTTDYNIGGVYVINVSPDILGLSTIETTNNKQIKQLTIRVEAGSGGGIKISQDKTYYYDFENRQNRVGIAWLNKLGGYDTFDFYGLETDNINRETKTLTVPRLINVDGSTSIGFKSVSTYDTSVTQKMTINSGLINKETFDWLIELMQSNNVYIYSNAYDNYVNITAFKYSSTSNDTQYSVEIECTYTIKENNISI